MSRFPKIMMSKANSNDSRDDKDNCCNNTKRNDYKRSSHRHRNKGYASSPLVNEDELLVLSSKHINTTITTTATTTTTSSSATADLSTASDYSSRHLQNHYRQHGGCFIGGGSDSRSSSSYSNTIHI
jgi:hypothetical protein